MATSPAWSPDGQRIAFISDQSGIPKVWTVSSNGGAAQNLERTNASDTDDVLTWFPSQEIVYQKPGLRNLLRVNGRTQEEKPIVRDDSVGWIFDRPVFSPDGNRIAVPWNRHGLGLWIISLEPYSETLVQAGELYPFGWSPDGKYLYAIRGREIVNIKLDSPKRASSLLDLEKLSDSSAVNLASGPVDHAGLSPDGRQIVVSAGNEKSDVWLMESFDPALGRRKN